MDSHIHDLCLVMNKIVAIEWIKGYSGNKLDKRDKELRSAFIFAVDCKGTNGTHTPPSRLDTVISLMTLKGRSESGWPTTKLYLQRSICTCLPRLVLTKI